MFLRLKCCCFLHLVCLWLSDCLLFVSIIFWGWCLFIKFIVFNLWLYISVILNLHCLVLLTIVDQFYLITLFLRFFRLFSISYNTSIFATLSPSLIAIPLSYTAFSTRYPFDDDYQKVITSCFQLLAQKEAILDLENLNNVFD